VLKKERERAREIRVRKSETGEPAKLAPIKGKGLIQETVEVRFSLS